MTFCEKWTEYDYNPYILFDRNGKITSLNNEAQYLLGYTDPASIFELALSYASTNVGFKTSFLDFEYGRFRFFALMVGYDNEDEIGIRLLQYPAFHYKKPSLKGDLLNIYTLIDLCISSSSIGSKTAFTKDFDPTLPEVRLHAENFIKLLNKVYSINSKAQTICTKLYFKIGEYIKAEDKKYTLFSIEIKSDDIQKSKMSDIKISAEDMNIFVDFKKESTVLNIPLITD